MTCPDATKGSHRPTPICGGTRASDLATATYGQNASAREPRGPLSRTLSQLAPHDLDLALITSSPPYSTAFLGTPRTGIWKRGKPARFKVLDRYSRQYGHALKSAFQCTNCFTSASSSDSSP